MNDRFPMTGDVLRFFSPSSFSRLIWQAPRSTLWERRWVTLTARSLASTRRSSTWARLAHWTLTFEVSRANHFLLLLIRWRGKNYTRNWVIKSRAEKCAEFEEKICQQTAQTWHARFANNQLINVTFHNGACKWHRFILAGSILKECNFCVLWKAVHYR